MKVKYILVGIKMMYDKKVQENLGYILHVLEQFEEFFPAYNKMIKNKK